MDSDILDVIESDESLKLHQDLIGEREISENLRYKIKEIERTSHSTIIQLQNELQSETQKSTRLELALKENCKYAEANAELQLKLKQAEQREKELKLKLVQLDDEKQDDSRIVGRYSFSGQHIHFTKRIKELETEVFALKNAQHKVIAERDLTVASLQAKLDDCEMYINTLTKELNTGTGATLVESMNDLQHKVHKLEKENQFLRKDLDFFNALTQEGLLKSQSELNIENDLKKRCKILEDELKVKDEDIDKLEKRLDDNRKLRNELVEYTVSLEGKISMLEEEKAKLEEEISIKDENIKNLEMQMNNFEQKSREEEEFMFQQLNRKHQFLMGQIKELQSKLTEHAAKNLEQVEAFNKEIADLKQRNTQLKKENTDLKDINLQITTDLSNTQQIMLELQDKLSEKYQKTIDELTRKIQTLTNEKLDLEQRVFDQSNIADFRSSFADAMSFEEELSKLGELRASWINVRKSITEERAIKYEGILEESAKKDAQIKTLQMENEELKKDVEKYKENYYELQNETVSRAGETEELLKSLDTARQRVRTLELELQRVRLSNVDARVLRFQLENETLRAEVEKLRTDLILSKNHFAEEINNLSEELTQNEKFVREARNEISKLTEERNIYRAYIEKLRKNKKVRKGSGPDITVLFR